MTDQQHQGLGSNDTKDLQDGRFAKWYECIADPVYLLSQKGDLVNLNQAAVTMSSYFNQHVEGSSFEIHLKQKLLYKLQNQYTGSTDTDNWSETLSLPLTSGKFIRICVTATVMMNESADRDLVIVIQNMSEKQALLQFVSENVSDFIGLLDKHGKYRFISRSYEALLGYHEGELNDQPAINWIHMEDREMAKINFYEWIESAIEKPKEIRFRHKNGQYVLMEVMGRPIFANGELDTIAVVGKDISARNKIEKLIKQMAYEDSLTQLPNRQFFMNRLSEEIQTIRDSEDWLAVMILDLDRFKLVNDTLGHGMGDQLLIAVSQRLKEIAPDNSLVARMGGDEFTILMPRVNARQLSEIIIPAEQVLEQLTKTLYVDGREFRITTSIGISIFPYDGEDAETLMRNADTAMYRAKDRGKNNYHLYNPAMSSGTLERLALEQDLVKALVRQELYIHYQPRVNLRMKQVVGVEALIRWKHSELGVIAPSEFIPLAEDTGLIVPIGEWVLYTACEQAKNWQDQGFEPIRMAVNISFRQFMRQDFIGSVKRILNKTGLDPSWLELEITETVIAQDVDVAIQTLHDLKLLGVSISIDDFGTGYSSLSYIKKFPIDTLKIDQSFVRDVMKQPEDAAIIQAIITLAKSLHLGVVAEGVETEEQRDFLHACNNEEMQGYLFSHPLSKEEMEGFLNKGFGD